MPSMKFLYTLSIALFVGIFSTFSILIAKGYRLSKEETGSLDLTKTGGILIKSIPDGANVSLNGQKSNPTNTSIGSLKPADYRVDITKEGYHEWSSVVPVQEELVSDISALLVKKAPEIKPVTLTGVEHPALNSDGTHVVFFATGKKERAVWVYSASGSSYLPGRTNPSIIAEGAELDALDTLTWSPDNSQIRATESTNTTALPILLTVEERTTTPFLRVANSTIEEEWKQQEVLKNLRRDQVLASFTHGKDLVGNSTAKLSVDEKRVLYTTTQETGTEQQRTQYHVRYLPDLLPVATERDLRVQITTGEEVSSVQWHATGEHLLHQSGDELSVMGADGKNKTTLITVPLFDEIVMSNGAGSVIILTSFTKEKLPNLHAVYFN